MSRNYHTIEDDGKIVTESSISKKRLKSVIARVTRKQDNAGRYKYKVAGAAWSGPSPVTTVEISIDGQAWQGVKLGERHGDYAWVLWSWDWDGATSGAHTLVSRAVDQAGNIQPTADEFSEKIKTLRENNSQWLRRIVL